MYLVHSESEGSPVEFRNELDQRIFSEIAAHNVGLVDLNVKRKVVGRAPLHVTLK